MNDESKDDSLVGSFLGTNYNPDVLSCLANLSNDEVFTPPDVVNQMLDMLPQELFQSPKTKFLDPVCKSGVFLREIAKRLVKGLKYQIPNLNMRIEHIFKNQLYGIAITELTSLVSRRSVYCSKYPNCEYSIVKFDDPEGNIRYRNTQHVWQGGKCIYCGASELEYGNIRSGKETHAYEFIHQENPNSIFNMKFDVIIGNPPYQMSDGGAQASASPIYQKFIEKAKQMNPQYITMIVPSRWFSGGKGLDDFRLEMLKDKHLRELVDYPIAQECFNGVSIKGGVCYFLWTDKTSETCKVTTVRNGVKSVLNRPLLEPNCSTFIRYNESISIFRKVVSKNEPTFDSLVSARKPFGFDTCVKGTSEKTSTSVKIYANKHVGYIDASKIKQNRQWVDKYKIFISRAYGAGEDFPHQILNKPFIGEPNSCCSETYLHIGPFEDEETTKNVLSYISTKFFRFMVLLIKNTQDAPVKVYSFVPMQDFSHPWTDIDLYEKYGLTEEEIAFIDSMIRPME